MRCLGVDFGLKKTGLALGDSESRIAAPLRVVLTRDLKADIVRTIASEGIECVVVGKPNHVARPDQEDARETFTTFVRELVPVFEIDERYTTKESRAMQFEGVRAEEDAIAAQLILEAYFNEL